MSDVLLAEQFNLGMAKARLQAYLGTKERLKTERLNDKLGDKKEVMTKTFYGNEASFFMRGFVIMREVNKLARERSAVSVTFEVEN